jgi:Tol biopolymer transport system component/predicted Ser/Thr protein kinase
MQFTPGSAVGSFKILSLLGIGGMGEVYLARDTRLGRDVALKILPEAFARDPERRARFEREARVLASLNHPNIATLHGLTQFEGSTILEMEFVTGETLAERMLRAPMTVDEILPVFKQIAQALEAAHDQGIIHRDLKPANIKITSDGRVKVLDFGLAKAIQGESSGIGRAGGVEYDMTSSHSQPGMILGTARYMSPEQARGKPLDRRSDIWSFGCVLYEAAAGKAPFVGDTGSDTLAAILKEEPDWTALATSPPLQRLARRCLRKDLQSRLRDIADARLEIEELMQDSVAMRSEVSTAPPRAARRTVAIGAASIVAVLIVVTTVVAWRSGIWRSFEATAPARVAIALLPGQQLAVGPTAPLALSADGRRLVYVAVQDGGRTQLYLRPLDRFEATAIIGTEGASAPFFSPDGEWIGFYANDALQKISPEGGAPLKICDSPPLLGATWLRDGSVIFSTTLAGDGLWRVSGDGGAPARVTEPDRAQKEAHHLFPQALPDEKTVLFNILTDQGLVGAIVALDTGKWRRLPQLRTSIGGAQFASTGHLIAAQAGGLVAIPFDPDTGETSGSPIPLAERIAAFVNGGTVFSVSQGGTLAYLPAPTRVPRRTLVVVDREGRAAPLSDVRAPYAHPRLSPDGRWLAITIESETGADVWLHDLQRGNRTRLTNVDSADFPVWSPDALHVAFHAARLGPWTLYMRVADGSGPAQPLLTGSRPDPAAAWSREPAEKLLPGFLPTFSGANPQYPMSWSPDGRTLVFTERKPNGERDIWVAERGSDPTPFLLTPSDEWAPTFSPDGQWIAYVSDESGRREVYVQGFPGPGGRWLISTEGGSDPAWSRDGRELYYLHGDQLMAVSIQTVPALNAGTPRLLFEGRYEQSDIGRNYDLSPDGKRFVMVRSDETEATAQIHVVLNWLDELKLRRQP